MLVVIHAIAFKGTLKNTSQKHTNTRRNENHLNRKTNEEKVDVDEDEATNEKNRVDDSVLLLVAQKVKNSFVVYFSLGREMKNSMQTENNR